MTDPAPFRVRLSCGCVRTFAADSPAIVNGWIRLGVSTHPCDAGHDLCIAEAFVEGAE